MTLEVPSVGTLQVRAVPLPASVIEILSCNDGVLKAMAMVGNQTSLRALEEHIDIDDFVTSNVVATDNKNYDKKGEQLPVLTEQNDESDDEEVDQLIERTKELTNSDKEQKEELMNSGKEQKKELINSGKENKDSLKTEISSSDKSNKSESLEVSNSLLVSIKQLKQKLAAAFDAEPGWEGAVEQMWSCGPHHSGANVLLNRSDHRSRGMWEVGGSESGGDREIINGFQLVCGKGLLCQEPLMGVCLVVEGWRGEGEPTRPGRVLAMSREALSEAVSRQPQRLMLAMFSCAVSVAEQVNTFDLLSLFESYWNLFWKKEMTLS